MTPDSEQIPVWLDCDPGHDDAFAILLAAYHENLKLLGISTVYGNAPLSKTTSNALSILKAIGREDIPVWPGALKPFSREIKHAPDIHGESGLDGTDLLPRPDRRPLTHCNAIKEMRDSLLSCPPHTPWLVVTGTLTNAALLFATFPEVSTHIKGLSIMGGATGRTDVDVYLGPDYIDSMGQKHTRVGNMSPFAEFNIWCDPEAAKSIFTNPDLVPKTTLITLDLTHQVCATPAVRDMLLFSRVKQDPPTKVRRMFYELLMFFAKTYEEVFGLADGPPLHDPLAVAALLVDWSPQWKGLFGGEQQTRFEVEVVTEGEQIGRTKITPSQDGVFVPSSVDLVRFWDMIEEIGRAHV